MKKTDYLCVQPLQARGYYWGKVGIDIETGERAYFVDRSKRKPHRPVEYGTWRQITIGDQYDRYSRRYYETTEFPIRGTSTMDQEIRDIIEESIDNHISYNLSKGFPTHFLEENRKKYSAFCHHGYREIFNNPMAYAHNPSTISLLFPFDSLRWLSDKEKTEFKQCVSHEVGHMKIASLSLSKQDILTIRSGFAIAPVKMRREPIVGGGGLLFPDEEIPRKLLEINLGEIANELELKEMDSEYEFSYPDFGKRINDLTRGALLISRYEGGMEYFIRALLEAIGDEREAKKILEVLTIAISGAKKQDLEEADILISRHERK